jgi:hypothetical protein
MKHLSIAVLALCCAFTAAGAEPVYKYRMPDGSIVYTSETLRDAKLLGTLREPLPAQPVDEKRKVEMQRESEKATQAGRNRSEAIAAANAQVAAATRALEAARARQAAGVEPEEGDRVGTVRGGGRGRAREAYIERQAELQEAVDAAQRELERAYQARNAAR